MTKAVILRTLGTVEQIDLPDEDGGYAVIRDAVGGYIDAVRADDFIGYVHDEGLLIGLAPNVMATFLFARPIVGDVVIVGCLNERGEYDGENHDVPDVFTHPDFIETCQRLADSEHMVNEVADLAEEAVNTPPQVWAVTDDEFDAWLENGYLPNRDPE